MLKIYSTFVHFLFQNESRANYFLLNLSPSLMWNIVQECLEKKCTKTKFFFNILLSLNHIHLTQWFLQLKVKVNEISVNVTYLYFYLQFTRVFSS